MKNYITRLLWLSAAFTLLAGVTPRTFAADPTPTDPAADNTQMNQGDQNPNAATADHAKQNLSDRELMRQIRRSVIQDDSLSMDAHNVKIIARNGVVTLKGPVKTPEEKQNVYAKATAVAGTEYVKDQITVKSESQ